jgi:integrase
MQPYRPTIVEYRLLIDVTGAKPAYSSRTPEGERVAKSTPGAVRFCRKSPSWWGKWKKRGIWLLRPQKLSGNLATARRILAEKIRQVELGMAGLTEDAGVAKIRPLADHLAEYCAYLVALERTAGHVAKTGAQITAACAGCGFQAAAQIDSGAVLLYLAGRRREGMGVETSNHYLQAMRQFCRWLRKRTGLDPLADVAALNADVDRRRVRRILPQVDIRKLRMAAACEPPRFGLNGLERSLLYYTALRTGLRASELASLTKSSLSFGDRPTVTVQAADSKHRREDRLPLRADLARELEAYCTTVTPTGTLWPGGWPAKAAAMLRQDLAAAGIPYRDVDGVIDFHALRYSFGSHLAEAGVHPKDIQVLMRHSTITLTMDRYVRRQVLDLGHQLEKLAS